MEAQGVDFLEGPGEISELPLEIGLALENKVARTLANRIFLRIVLVVGALAQIVAAWTESGLVQSGIVFGNCVFNWPGEGLAELAWQLVFSLINGRTLGLESF